MEKLSRVVIAAKVRVVAVFVIVTAAASSATTAQCRRLDVRDLGITHRVVEIDQVLTDQLPDRIGSRRNPL